MKRILVFIGLSILVLNGFSQSSDKLARYFDNPIMIDTTNTILIPTRYNTKLLSSSKIGLKNDYYANILITSSDSSTPRKLFETDTYILPIRLNESTRYNYKYSYQNSRSISNNWIFFFVKNYDFDNNNRIDEKDPTILYVTDLSLNKLKKLTKDNENVIDYFVYENQNVIMVKIQRDLNRDRNFTYKDKDFYFLFLDYKTLIVIKQVDIK